MLDFYPKMKNRMAKGTGCNFKILMLVAVGWVVYEVVVPFV